MQSSFCLDDCNSLWWCYLFKYDQMLLQTLCVFVWVWVCVCVCLCGFTFLLSQRLKQGCVGGLRHLWEAALDKPQLPELFFKSDSASCHCVWVNYKPRDWLWRSCHNSGDGSCLQEEAAFHHVIDEVNMKIKQNLQALIWRSFVASERHRRDREIQKVTSLCTDVHHITLVAMIHLHRGILVDFVCSVIQNRK